MTGEAGPRFVIPTPGGPVEILSITRKAAGERSRSAVLRRDSYEPLRLSARYREFVGETGPLGAAGLDPKAEIFIVQLSADIDSGDSWNLALLLAHAAEADREGLGTALAAAPALVVASGSLAFDPRHPIERQGFRAERYALAEKVESLIRDGGPFPERTVLLLPAAAEPDDLERAERRAREALPPSAVVARCTTAGDALRILAAAVAPAVPAPPPVSAAAPVPAPAAPARPRRTRPALLGAGALAAAAVAAVLLLRPEADPPSRPSAGVSSPTVSSAPVAPAPAASTPVPSAPAARAAAGPATRDRPADGRPDAPDDAGPASGRASATPPAPPAETPPPAAAPAKTAAAAPAPDRAPTPPAPSDPAPPTTSDPAPTAPSDPAAASTPPSGPTATSAPAPSSAASPAASSTPAARTATPPAPPEATAPAAPPAKPSAGSEQASRGTPAAAPEAPAAEKTPAPPVKAATPAPPPAPPAPDRPAVRLVALTAPAGASCALVALEQVSAAEVVVPLEGGGEDRRAALPAGTCGVALFPPPGWSVRWAPALRSLTMTGLAYATGSGERRSERLIARRASDLSGRTLRLSTDGDAPVVSVD